jgi:hypothetical protein
MRRVGAILLAAVMITTPMASALPTPGLFGEEARTVTGRLFPEAMETNDFASLEDALDGLKTLEEENPDLVTYHEIGQSYGWDNAAGGHDTFPTFAVTVTNEASTVPDDEKLNVLFMLSIHGNEKGGREGGLRVIEDFAKAANDETDTGVATEDRLAMLDYTRLIFLFPNPDGWTHEQAEYRQNDAEYLSVAGVETQNYVRGNGNGTDLNRQAPTTGWSRGNTTELSHAALKEPETRAFWTWLTTNFTDIHLASDLHGMLYPANALIDSSREVQCVNPPNVAGEGEVCLREGNFVLTMLPAAQMEPAEVKVTTALAELIKQRLNANPSFAEWNAAPEAGAWGGEFNDWGTVWDTIGYVDSGFSSDFFAQNDGLDAPGVDFEFAYNHLTFDNYYSGVSQRMNAYHIETTRTIVGSFMDVAAETFQVEIETNGTETAYVPTEDLATSEDNDELTGWASVNDADDNWDWENDGYNATPNAYFEDRQPYLVDDGEANPAQPLTPEAFGSLDRVDNLVVPGSAAERILGNGDAVAALETFVEDGGNLLLTDSALRLLAPLDVVDASAIDEASVYAGHTNFVDRDHELADGVRGLARQTFEPMPLGFEEGENAPAWFVDRSALQDADGETVGQLDEDQVNLGQVTKGQGEISFVGALLPNPSEAYYHPYGLADYATTYTGNQIVRNALDWQMSVDRTPRENTTDPSPITGENSADGEELDAASTDADDGPMPVPGFGILAVLSALAAALIALRRQRW